MKVLAKVIGRNLLNHLFAESLEPSSFIKYIDILLIEGFHLSQKFFFFEIRVSTKYFHTICEIIVKKLKKIIKKKNFNESSIMGEALIISTMTLKKIKKNQFLVLLKNTLSDKALNVSQIYNSRNIIMMQEKNLAAKSN